MSRSSYVSEPNEIFQHAIEQGNLGLAALDADGRYVAVNAALLAMHGWSESDLLGKHWEVTVHPQDRKRAREAYRLARSSGRSYLEVRALRDDAVVVYQALTVTAVTDEGGNFAGYHCCSPAGLRRCSPAGLRHDITSHQRNHEALSLAVEAAPNGLVILNLNGEIQSANPAVERLFGYQRDQLTGQTIETLFPSSFADHARAAKGQSLLELTLAVSGLAVFGMSRTGVRIPLQVYLNRVETSAGELILCTMIDITERIRYQDQLELAKKAAETTSRAKSDFPARMSHEIRTPMNLIMGMNALAAEQSAQRQTALAGGNLVPQRAAVVAPD